MYGMFEDLYISSYVSLAIDMAIPASLPVCMNAKIFNLTCRLLNVIVNSSAFQMLDATPTALVFTY